MRHREQEVAQIFNLLYRRILFGQAWELPGAPGLRTTGGLQIRDTADYKSALRRPLPCVSLQCGQKPHVSKLKFALIRFIPR